MLWFMDPIKVVIFAPDPLVRAGLATLLADETSLIVSGQVGYDQAIEEIDTPEPDVLLWDVGWEPAGSHPDLTQYRLPIVAMVPNVDDIAAARQAGATGFLTRDSEPEQIIAAIQAVSQGLLVIDAEFEGSLGDLTPQEAYAEDGPELTPRELQVLQLLTHGMTNKAIAHRLSISEYTVKFHLNAIMSKLDAQSRTEAVVIATRRGLISL